MLLSRPVVVTDNIAGHRALLDALGGSVVVDHGGFVVYALDNGQVALHSPVGSPSGTLVLAFVSDDLDAIEAAATGAGLDVRRPEDPRRTYLRITAADGTTLDVDLDRDLGAPSAPADPDNVVSILPIWLTPATDAARATLTGIGALPRVTGDNGVWSDFTCPAGGLVAVHADHAAGTTHAFEYSGDLDALAARLTQAGIAAEVMDENYSRVVLVADPDGGKPLWINGTQTDLYGYRAER